MKKLLAAVLLLVLPMAAFADFQVGAVGLYNGTLASAATTSSISLSDFTYGGEARLKLWILEGGLSALYVPGGDYYYDTVLAFTDVGVAFDLLFLRLGAGVGPNFTWIVDKSYTGGNDTLPLGFNAKVTAEILLGDLSLGAVGYSYFDSFSDLSAADLSKSANWMVGLTLMFKLF